MKRGLQGRELIQRHPGESYKAFVPNPLPPKPGIVWDDRLTDLQECANRAVGRLDGVARILPDISPFLYYYLRKEAVLSSQIEGTQSSMSDLLMFENGLDVSVPLDDVREVSHYAAALDFAMTRMDAGDPLTLRLIREVHGVLLRQGSGSDLRPGEFRRSQNWIGGARPGDAAFVPPPYLEVMGCMGAWEDFLHNKPVRTPTLVKAALMHVQFETIHPFLDGNGRVGRLMIPLLLCYERALERPLLYLSLYFKKHRRRYYELLQEVRSRGDWEAWLAFFFQGVAETADQGVSTARAILKQSDSDRATIQEFGRASGSALRLHQWAQSHWLFTIATACAGLNLSVPAVTSAVRRMQQKGILREASGKKRGRVYIYGPLLDLLMTDSEGEADAPPAG